ncbi:MAG: ATP-dependent zinc protease [Desulfobacterales bacterium]|nr:ATP-dependent zinc protease [Desulfobacterales bacterium]
MEQRVDLQTGKTDMLMDLSRDQKQLLAESTEQNTDSFQKLDQQLQELHNEIKSKLSVLENPATPQPVSRPVLEKSGTDKLLIGRLEKVRLTPPGRIFHARIDTGATTSSLDARNVEIFERDGSRWVKFQIQDPEEETFYEVEKPVVRRVRIIHSSTEDFSRRPVIELQFQIGRIKRIAEFTLEDRSHLDYQVLIGRNILRDLMVVDVAQEFIAPLPEENTPSEPTK